MTANPRTPTAVPTAAPVDNPFDPVLAPDELALVSELATVGSIVTVCRMTLPPAVIVDRNVVGDAVVTISAVLVPVPLSVEV